MNAHGELSDGSTYKDIWFYGHYLEFILVLKCKLLLKIIFSAVVTIPRFTPSVVITQNGKFVAAEIKFKNGLQSPELIKVFEKIKDEI